MKTLSSYLNELPDQLKRLFGPIDERSLPEHIQRSIARREESSELLISCSQLGAIIFFILLYLISPTTAPENSPFIPTPYFLFAYLAITLIRFYLAQKRCLSDPLCYLSIVIDFVLLYGLIWSFHLQYTQPAAFYLKSPTLLYAFTFIALRTLRFQISHVAFAGVVAAVGWLFLAWLALFDYDLEPVVTRDYVEYLTSNSVLLGAEIDKIISILVVTATLMLAIGRARILMIRSILERNTAQDLSRFVPAAVATQMSEKHNRAEAGDRERREATVLFVDIEGFTSLVETLEPEEVIEILNDYFSVAGDIIEEQGGVINQFQGDAILASFNIPDPQPKHASGAIHAGLALLEALKQRRFSGDRTINVRVGICTGTLVGGIVGTGSRLSYTVHGDIVNTAARLEQLNKKYQTRLMVSGSTVEHLTEGEFKLTEMGEVALSGKQIPTKIYSIQSEN